MDKDDLKIQDTYGEPNPGFINVDDDDPPPPYDIGLIQYNNSGTRFITL